MKNMLNFSWKDIGAGLLGYVTAAFLVGGVYWGVLSMGARTGDTTLWSRYELLIGCATFLGFFIGGIVLGAVRSSTAIRNAIMLCALLVILGIVRSPEVMLRGGDMIMVGGQISGLLFGAWTVQYRVMYKKEI